MFILLFSVIFISVGYSQCPKAEMYKKKSKEAFNDGNKAMRNNPTLVGANYSSNQMGAPDAYIILSAYEAYVCQCKNQNNGEEAERLKNFINKEYVQRYASMVSKYGSMPKVTSCKGGEGEEKAEASEEKNKEKATPLESDKKANNKEAINKVAKEMRLREDEVEILNIFNNSKNINEAWSKLNAKGIKNLNKYTLEAIEKLLATNPNFSINASELQSLKEGNSFNEILKNYNFKQSNKIAQQLGLNYQQTELLNIVATSNNKEEMMKRINQKGMQNISDKATQGIQKLLGDSYGSLPITSGDITNILQGNYTGAVENIVKNQQINNLTKSFGGNRQLAQASHDLISGVAASIEAAREERTIKAINFINSHNRENFIKGKRNSNFVYNANFNDNYWTTKEVKYVTTKVIDKNIYQIKFIEDVDRKELRKDDFHFLTFSHENFDPLSDFEISFQIGYPTVMLQKRYKRKKTRLLYGNQIGFFISGFNKVGLGPINSGLSLSFTPEVNTLHSISRFSLANEALQSIFYQHLHSPILTSEEVTNKYYNPDREYQRNKYYREVYKDRKRRASLISNLAKSANEEDFTFISCKIIKEGNKFYLEKEYDINGSKEKVKTGKINYKYLKNNELSFGLSGTAWPYNLGGKKGHTILLKNFKIKQ